MSYFAKTLTVRKLYSVNIYNLCRENLSLLDNTDVTRRISDVLMCTDSEEAAIRTTPAPLTAIVFSGIGLSERSHALANYLDCFPVHIKLEQRTCYFPDH